MIWFVSQAIYRGKGTKTNLGGLPQIHTPQTIRIKSLILSLDYVVICQSTVVLYFSGLHSDKRAAVLPQPSASKGLLRCSTHSHFRRVAQSH